MTFQPPPSPVVEIDEAAFPILDDSEVAVFEALGTRRRVEAGE
jgi:hypothetical protein